MSYFHIFLTGFKRTKSLHLGFCSERFWFWDHPRYVHVQTTEVAATAKLQVPVPSTQACTSLASGSRPGWVKSRV